MSFSTNTARRLSLGVVVAALTVTGTALSQSTSYANGYGAQPTQPAFPVSNTSYCSGSPVIADQTLVSKPGDELGPVSETFNANFPTVLSNCASGQTIEIAPNTASGFYGIVVKPFTLPAGVTLQIDAGVTMYGSLNPSDYQVNGITPAAATATLTPSASTVASIALDSAGSNCPNPASVTVGGGSYTVQAQASAVVVNGAVQSFAVTNPGMGYTSAPTSVTVTGCSATGTATLGYGVQGITVVPGYSGAGYSTNGDTPAHAVVTAPPDGSGPGTQATASVTLSNGSSGSISSITVTNQGSGYSSSNPPAVFFADTCGINDRAADTSQPGIGCSPLITIGTNTSTTPPGTSIIGYGTIDGRGDEPLVDGSGNPRILNGYNGTYTNYLNAPIADMSTGCGFLDGKYSWYCLAANIYNYSPNYHQNNPMLIYGRQANNFTLYQIALRNAPYFTVRWAGLNSTTSQIPKTTGLISWRTKINNPFTARNSDGIDPIDNAENVYIYQNYISNGDDNFAAEANVSSAAYDNSVQNITVTNSYSYTGDGWSVGSPTLGGISNALFTQLYMAGNPNLTMSSPPPAPTSQTAFKLKTSDTNGGNLNNVTYNDICMADQVQTFQIDENWSGSSPGTNYPTFTNIVLNNLLSLANTNGASGLIYLEGYTDANNNDNEAHASAADVALGHITLAGTAASPIATEANLYEYTNSQDQTGVPTIAGPNVSVKALSSALPQTSSDTTFLSNCTYSKAVFPDYAVDLFVSISPYTGAESNMTSAPNPGDTISVSANTSYTLTVVLTPTNTRWDSANQIYVQNLQPATSAIVFWDPNGSGTNLGSPTTAVAGSNGTIYTLTRTAVEAGVGTHPYQVQVTNSDGTITYSNTVHVTVTN
jgi:polygalacturonase